MRRTMTGTAPGSSEQKQFQKPQTGWRMEYEIPSGPRNYLRGREKAIAEFGNLLVQAGAIRLREERVQGGWKLIVELQPSETHAP